MTSETPPSLVLQRIAFWALVPLVAPQGIWLRLRAPRFAGAEGPASGSVGTGSILRLAAIGDSIVAGVGARTFDEALVGRFAAALAARLSMQVEWRALGRTGARAVGVRTNLVPALPPGSWDIVLVSVGVNDVTGLVSCSTWAREVGGLIDALRERAPDARIVMAGLPPLGSFPLLPWPLRYVFGMRARTFDRVLRSVTLTRDRCTHVPTDFEPSPEKFSADGYHPSAESYRVWGEALAERIVELSPA